MSKDAISLRSKDNIVIELWPNETFWIVNPIYEYMFRIAILVSCISILIFIILFYIGEYFVAILQLIIALLVIWILPISFPSKIGLQLDGIQLKRRIRSKPQRIRKDDPILKVFPGATHYSLCPEEVKFFDIKDYHLLLVKYSSIENGIDFSKEDGIVARLSGIDIRVVKVIVNLYEIWKEQEGNDYVRMEISKKSLS